MSRRLDFREPDFRDRDAFLYALLGVVSCGSKLEAALRKLASAPDFAPAPDRQIDAVLGLLALWIKAKRELSRWRETARPQSEAEPDSGSVDWSSWHR